MCWTGTVAHTHNLATERALDALDTHSGTHIIATERALDALGTHSGTHIVAPEHALDLTAMCWARAVAHT